MGEQGIHDAASGGDLGTVRRLLAAGESPDVLWIQGWNALPFLVISRVNADGRLRVASHLLSGDHLFVAPLANILSIKSRGHGGLSAIAELAARHPLPRVKLAAWVWRQEVAVLRGHAFLRQLPRSASAADLDWLQASIATHWSAHPLLMTLLAALGSAAPAPSTPPAAVAASSAGATSP